jgi:hypothetical protein
MTAAVISGLLAGYGIAMPVGAIALFLIRLGRLRACASGQRPGWARQPWMAGYALAGVAGGEGLAGQIGAVARPVHLAAGMMLPVVAAWMAAAAFRRYRSGSAAHGVGLALRSPLRAYSAGRGDRGQPADRGVLGSAGPGPAGLGRRPSPRPRPQCSSRPWPPPRRAGSWSWSPAEH